MRYVLPIACAAMTAAFTVSAHAESKHDGCVAYAREAAASAQTSTGPLRGAARGAVGGAVLGNPGAGAGMGAIVGTARRADQQSKSYQFYYDQCMAR